MFALLETPEDLLPWVQCIWTMSVDGCELPEAPIAPDGCCEWIVNLAAPSEAWRDPDWVRQPRAFLFGQLQAPLLLRSRQASSVLAVRLRPHAVPALLRVSGADLHPLELPLPDLLKGRMVRRWLGEFDSLQAAYPRMIALLRGLAAEALPRDPLAVEAVGIIDRGQGMPRIAALASRLGTTPRTLERRFLNATGLSPKRYARIRRMQNGLRLLGERGADLADVAAECGYADQAHMTRELVELAGRRPGEIVRGA